MIKSVLPRKEDYLAKTADKTAIDLISIQFVILSTSLGFI